METNQSTDRIRAIFDNGGGITIQLGEWAHYYSGSPKNAAEDYSTFIRTRDTSDWEGHESESDQLEPTTDEIRNGGYRVMELADVILAVYGQEQEWAWNNQADFIRKLRADGGLPSVRPE